MPAALFAGIVVLFVVVGVLVIRATQKGRIVAGLPIDADETVLLDEQGLKVFHRFRRMAARGGGTVTHRVRAVLTDRRILVVTGGPEGKHKFVIAMILDYTAPERPVPGTGYDAYKRKFQLGNGYPTYLFTAADVSVDDDPGDPGLRIVVPFPERGSGWGDPPEVKLHTKQARRYLEAVARR